MNEKYNEIQFDLFIKNMVDELISKQEKIWNEVEIDVHFFKEKLDE